MVTVVHKLAGKFWSYRQNHTPFDVVAWHGKLVPLVTPVPLLLPLPLAKTGIR